MKEMPTGGQLEFLINHVILPPKLPQGDDSENIEGEDALLKLTQEAVSSFLAICPPDKIDVNAWKHVSSALATWGKVRSGNTISEESLQDSLTDMGKKMFIPLYIRAQNAGMLFRSVDDETVVLDTFEASPTAAAVLASKGRLTRHFPESTVTMPVSHFSNEHFTKELARYLRMAMEESIDLFIPKTKKAGSLVRETRDSTDPALITSLLTNMLAGIEGASLPSAAQVTKRMRDDSNWDSAKIGWRRSPFWTVLRVTLQLMLAQLVKDENSAYFQYKNFMSHLMCILLRKAVSSNVPIDVQKIMCQKIATRIFKLSDGLLFQVSEIALEDLKSSRSAIEKAWKCVQQNNHRNLKPLSPLAAIESTHLSLKSTRQVLEDAMCRDLGGSISNTQLVTYAQRLHFSDNGLPRPINVQSSSTRQEKTLCLADIESWVQRDLQPWVGRVTACPQVCEELAVLSADYLAQATSHYHKTSALDMSLAILVTMELWSALDKMCVTVYPLLREYSPEIPTTLFEPLLLPHLEQMQRLANIEAYLSKRHQEADRRLPSIFGDLHPLSFGTRYACASPEHQNLKERIESAAARKRQAKQREHEQKQSEYVQLRRIADGAHDVRYNIEGNQYCYRCSACRAHRESKSMTIKLDEWPLPTDAAEINNVIFELACPKAFALWRDQTWRIFHGLGHYQKQSAGNVEQRLSDYTGLVAYFESRGQQLSLASWTKPFSKTHYEPYKFPVTLSKICVKNGLLYRLYDSNSGTWASAHHHQPNIARFSAFMNPVDLYKDLAPSLACHKVSSNRAIAAQQDCPQDMSLHEHYAFSVLREGERVQWINILREFMSNNLSFNRDATCKLILGAAWEARSPNPDSVRRDAHRILEDSMFCDLLLQALSSMRLKIEKNWTEQQTLYLLINISSRILSLTTSSEVKETAVSQIRHARKIALQWTAILLEQLNSIDGDDENDTNAYQQHAMQCAALCLLTFDLGVDHGDLAVQSDSDVADFIDAAVAFHNCRPLPSKKVSHWVEFLALRVEKVFHHVESAMRNLIQASNIGISAAIGRACPLVRDQCDWRFLESPNERLAVCEASTEGQHSQIVSFNVLSGELLVNGLPLGRLPPQYMDQELYHRLFGSLIVRAEKEGGSYEIVPHNTFASDFPRSLVDPCVHWLNLKTGEVDFRHYATPWDTKSAQWRMSYTDIHTYVARCENLTLIDTHSAVNKNICEVLSSFERKSNIVVCRTADGAIEVQLPRFDISFFLNEQGLLESRQLRASIALDQDPGTLYGLQHMLILQSTAKNDCGTRSILIPRGQPHVVRRDAHVAVTILMSGKEKVKYFRYTFDPLLNRIKDPNVLESRYYRALLHGLTSYCLPDPFTQQTGTEQALQILRSAAAMPAFPLSPAEIMRLNEIAALTPTRRYYPEYLCVMQRIGWNNELSQLSQSDEFHPCVQEIVNHWRSLSILYPAGTTKGLPSEREHAELVERARFRNSTFLRPDASDIREIPQDREYLRAGLGNDANRCHGVLELSSIISKWPSRLGSTQKLVEVVKRWTNVAGPRPDTESTLDEFFQVKMQEDWLTLYELCRHCNRERDSHALMFRLCTMIYSCPEDRHLFLSLLIVATSSAFSSINPPTYSVYPMQEGFMPNEKQLMGTLNNCLIRWVFSGTESGNSDAERARHRRDEKNQYERDQTLQVCRMLEKIKSQWPCESLDLPVDLSLSKIDTQQVRDTCNPLFETWYRNRQLILHLTTVQEHLNGQHAETPAFSYPSRQLYPVRAERSQDRRTITALPDLVRESVVSNLPRTPDPWVKTRDAKEVLVSPEDAELRHILKEMESKNEIRSKYALDLLPSLDALKTETWPDTPASMPVPLHTLEDHEREAQKYFSKVSEVVKAALGPPTTVSEILFTAELWPLTTNLNLLSRLATRFLKSMHDTWKSIATKLGLAVALVQRARRMVLYAQQNDVLGFFSESENPGHENWQPLDYPDWLLMEVENNFMIRYLQAEVAFRMMHPPFESNSVMQLNMGEGKSSVIIPMIAAACANGQQLARVIVLKPLLRQTEQQLVRCLGGMVNRRIFHTPISRKHILSPDDIISLQFLFEKCANSGDVLVSLEEHIMSFRLMGRDKILVDQQQARLLMSTEEWLQMHCRDILDESDDLLNTRFQLVYTTGSQRMIDGQGERWSAIIHLLSLVKKNLIELSEISPQNVDIQFPDGSFPTINNLKSDALQMLLQRLLKDVVRGELVELSLLQLSEEELSCVERYIRDVQVTTEDIEIVDRIFSNDVCRPILLLLRGLFACSVLPFALMNKRWMVEYGLDPTRCLMAVPYHAKGVPSANSEFGHPDVAILLTCLSFYFTGLTDEQLKLVIELIMKTDDPDAEFSRITSTCSTMPENLKSLQAVNLEDRLLCTSQLYPALKYSKAAVDFYLDRVVFAREAKEFEYKLSTSAWDLPLSVQSPGITTGFSGTNDNKALLPMNIEQRDLEKLRHTNAAVLTTILRPQNRKLIETSDENGRRLPISGLLKLISGLSPRIQVLIDVGAQVLDFSNYQIATSWLDASPEDVSGCVYFNERDEIMVVDRSKKPERLAASSFSGNLEKCLIYLDEVHTRGVDLALPNDARAAVTLGPRLTKDRFVQACMRLRKLSQKQSVVVLASPNVYEEIEALSKSDTELDMSDVVRWTFEQTCALTEAIQPLAIAQGIEFCRREQCMAQLMEGHDNIENALDDEGRAQAYARAIVEPEAKTLEEMYGTKPRKLRDLEGPGLPPFTAELLEQQRKLGSAAMMSSDKHEEQEREVAHEREQERQIEKPAALQSLKHKLHPNVLLFAETGELRMPTNGFCFAFDSLDSSTATSLLSTKLDSTMLCCTTDFAQTVKLPDLHKQDEYLRPVHWILSSTRNEQLVIISPFEAEALLPTVEKSRFTTLHVYAARTARTMQSFNKLDYYSIGATLPETRQTNPLALCKLNLFAGSLYPDDIQATNSAAGFYV